MIIIPKKRKNKYNRSKAVYNEIKFDSRLERNQYKVFLEEYSDLVSIIELQPSYKLMEGFTYFDIERNKVRKFGTMKYTPDFKIKIKGLDKLVIWETKGMITTDFNMRKKIWYNLYGKEFYYIQSSSMKHQRLVLDELQERIKNKNKQ